MNNYRPTNMHVTDQSFVVSLQAVFSALPTFVLVPDVRGFPVTIDIMTYRLMLLVLYLFGV